MQLVQGLTTYIPPLPDDFDFLQKTQKGGTIKVKGKDNKEEKKKIKGGQAQFPLRTIQIDYQFLNHNQEFFMEYDFFFMLFLIIMALFALSQTLKAFYPEMLETNLVLYMMIFTYLLCVANLMKNTFALGYCTCSDEAKVEFLMAIKAVLIVFVLFMYVPTNQIFDFDLESSHVSVIRRVNDILYLWNLELELPVEFTYSIISILAALISFVQVRLTVKFAYYFYMLQRDDVVDMLKKNEFQKARYRLLLKIMYFNFIAPLIVALMFIPSLFKVYVVPVYISDDIWKIVRVFVIVITIMMKMLTFREELQFQFNESYFLVQKLMQDADEKIFRYIRLRMQQNFLEVWFTVFQQIASISMPMILLLCYTHRIVSFFTTPQTSLNFDHLMPKQDDITPASQYEIFTGKMQSETKSLLDLSDKTVLTGIFHEINSKGLFTFEYQEGIFGFMLFWYYFSQFFIQVFALLYYRKFKSS